MEPSNSEILQKAIADGIIDINTLGKQIEMNERKKYLDMHKYNIWQGEKDHKWYTYLPDHEKGRRLVKRASKSELEDEIISFFKEEEYNPTIEEVFNEWNDHRLDIKKIGNATHLRNQQIFRRHYFDFGDRKIKTVRLDEISDFLEVQIPNFNLTAKSFSNLKSITRGFLKRAKKRRLINFNVEELFQELDTTDTDFKIPIKEDFEEVFDEDEMPEMISYLSKHADMQNVAILLMFVTGARIGEIVALKHSDFEGMTFKIRRTETRYKMDGKYVCSVKDFPKSQAGVRTVIIPKEYEWLVKKIKMLNPFSDYIFLNKNKERIHTHSIRMRLRRVCDKLGIYRKSPHKIRKTYGTILLDNNIDKQLIVGQMGHTDIVCTEKHYHRNRKSVDKKSEILSSIPDFKIKKV